MKNCFLGFFHCYYSLQFTNTLILKTIHITNIYDKLSSELFYFSPNSTYHEISLKLSSNKSAERSCQIVSKLLQIKLMCLKSELTVF